MTGHSRKHVTGNLNSSISLDDSQSIVKVIDIRGGNITEVQYPNGNTVLAIIPSKFNRTLWIKKGNYAIVDKVDDDISSTTTNSNNNSNSSKVKTTIVHILTKDAVKDLVKSNQWPKEFELENKKNQTTMTLPNKLNQDSEDDSDGGLDDLAGNPNHRRFDDDDDSESEEDSDEDEEEDN
eukprot:gene5176-6444_t